MIITHNFDFGTFQFHEYYVVGVITEGISFNAFKNQLFLEACKAHFNDAPFGYISYRRHSNSVDPTIYLETEKLGQPQGHRHRIPYSGAKTEY